MKTEAIDVEDVQRVAKDVFKRELTDEEVELVLEHYDGEEEADPTGTWDLIVEHCIYCYIINA